MSLTPDKIVILGADHNGVRLKQIIKSHLQKQGFRCIDIGPYEEDKSVDYVDYAMQLGQIVARQEGDIGVLICGTGIGMSIAVNRVDKIRAALVHNMMSAIKSREHNDANVLCIGSWINDDETNVKILDTWMQEKFGELRHVKRVEKLTTPEKDTIVFANGIFDILHTGHINLLKFSKSLGGKLVVGINSDRATKALKGEGRPVNSESDRKAVLQSIYCVDEVIIFDDFKPTELIMSLQPHIIVKGGEWTEDVIRQRDQIPENIQIKVFPVIEGYSTTNTIATIKKRPNIEVKTPCNLATSDA